MLQKEAGPGVIAGAVLAVLLVVGLLAWSFLKPQDGKLDQQEQQAVDQSVEDQYKSYFPAGGAPGGTGAGAPGGPAGGSMGGMPGSAPGSPMGGMPGTGGQ